MKDTTVYYCVDCTQCCIDPHKPNRAKKHNDLPLKKFKNKIDQYLSQDDFLWEQAISIQYKLQELQKEIRKLKIEMMQTVYEKKLAYALQWDTADKIVQSFKAARDGHFDKLTCANAFRIYQKVDRNRNINEKEVKRLAKEIIDDTKLAVQGIVQRWSKANQSIKGRYQKQEVQDRRRDRENQPRQQKIQRQERRRVRQYSDEEKPALSFANDYPVLKIKQIQDVETHFNVVVKVMRIHKEFKIGTTNKIQFMGGDSTGTATVVVDLSRTIRVGAVISISNARVYSFHGTKQIQQSMKQSQVKEERIIINDINEGFNMSEKRGKNGRGKRYEDRRDIGDRVDRVDRGNREERRDRVDRPQRLNQSELVQKADLNSSKLNRTHVVEDRPRRNYRNNRYSDQESQGQTKKKQKIVQEQQEKPQKKPAQQKSKVIQKPVNKRKQQLESESQSSDEDQEQIEEQQKFLNKKPQNITQIKIPNITKIKDIEPADQNLTIFAQIVTIDKSNTLGVKPEKGHFICVIGDDTAVVRAQLPKHSQAVKEGVVVKINNVNAVVDKDHRITLKLGEEGLCERTNIRIPKVNISLDQSKQQWQSEGQQEQQEQQDKQAIIEDF